jgi:glycosyltransferase involved in cell wall biosynthesis
MSEFPRVTVVTPSYNQAAFIEQTLCSVLDQDYPNLEYLVVDGASQDGSVEIIQKYADRLTWWVSEPDHGQAEAINKGFARASGEIVGWVNSDDLYLPGCVASAVTVLQQNPDLVMVYGDMAALDSDGVVINLLRSNNWNLDDLLCFEILNQPAVFMRRDALVQAGFLETQFHFMLDHHLWLRIAQLGSIMHVPQVWAAARYHAGAKNISQTAGFSRDAFAIVEWMQTQPILAARFPRLQRKIHAGLYCLDAFYLLNGGYAREALHSYLRAFAAYPSRALRDLRRIAYAFASLFVNVDHFRQSYLRRRQQRLEGIILPGLHDAKKGE